MCLPTRSITMVNAMSSIITTAPTIAPVLFFFRTSVLLYIHKPRTFFLPSSRFLPDSPLHSENPVTDVPGSDVHTSPASLKDLLCDVPVPSDAVPSRFCRLFLFSKRSFISSIEISILRNSLIS